MLAKGPKFQTERTINFDFCMQMFLEAETMGYKKGDVFFQQQSLFMSLFLLSIILICIVKKKINLAANSLSFLEEPTAAPIETTTATSEPPAIGKSTSGELNKSVAIHSSDSPITTRDSLMSPGETVRIVGICVGILVTIIMAVVNSKIVFQ